MFTRGHAVWQQPWPVMTQSTNEITSLKKIRTVFYSTRKNKAHLFHTFTVDWVRLFSQITRDTLSPLQQQPFFSFSLFIQGNTSQKVCCCFPPSERGNVLPFATQPAWTYLCWLHANGLSLAEFVWLEALMFSFFPFPRSCVSYWFLCVFSFNYTNLVVCALLEC